MECLLCKNSLPESHFYKRTRPSGIVYTTKKCRRCLSTLRGGPDQLIKVRERMARKEDTFFKRMITTSRGNAKKKGRLHTIRLCDIEKLWESQGGKCVLSGVEMIKSSESGNPAICSIDRINNDGGYTPDNVQLVTHWVNRSKFVFGVERFEQLILETAQHINKKKLTL